MLAITQDELIVLADTVVYVMVRPSANGPEPAAVVVEGERAAVVFRDEHPQYPGAPGIVEGYSVIPLVLAQAFAYLPDPLGIVVNPGPGQLWIPRELKEQVCDAGLPFPQGAPLRIGEPEEEPTEMLQAVCSLAAGVSSLRWIRRSWYQVGLRSPRLLFTFECGDAEVGMVMGLLAQAAQSVHYPGRFESASARSLPDGLLPYLYEHVPAFYQR